MKPAGWGIGCNTYSYIRSHRVDACLERLADCGFEAFEVMVHPGHLWPAERRGIALLRRVLDARQARLVSLNMPNTDINITAEAPEMREQSLLALEAALRLAGEAGASGFVLGPGKANVLFPPPRDVLMSHFFAALDRLIPVAKAAGTAVWVENIPFAFLPGIEALSEALDRYGDDSLGVVYDIANAHYLGEDIGAGLMRCRKRLRLVHLSDTGRAVYRHDPVGRGTVPVAEIPNALAAVGYDDVVMLEIITDEPDRDMPASVAALAACGIAGERHRTSPT